jgi:hypothetical protein
MSHVWLKQTWSSQKGWIFKCVKHANASLCHLQRANYMKKWCSITCDLRKWDIEICGKFCTKWNGWDRYHFGGHVLQNSQGRYKAQTTIVCGVLWWQRNGFEVTKNSYGGRNNFNLIWMDQIKKWTSGGGCSNGGTLRNSHGGYELRASPKAHSQDDREGTTMHSPMNHLKNYRKKKK